MKKNLIVRHLAVTNNQSSMQGHLPVPTTEFYPTGPDGLSGQMGLQKLFTILNGLNPFHKPFKNTSNPVPAIESPVKYLSYPPKKIHIGIAEWQLYINLFLKQVGSRLSDIEMSIFTNDVHRLQFASHSLKGLLVNMNIPTASRLAVEMEELAYENKMQEANKVLLSIKKIIARVAQYSQQVNNK